MAITSLESFCSPPPPPPPDASLDKDSGAFMASSPIFSPSSDKRFWSTLRSRIDTLLENRSSVDPSLPNQNGGLTEGAKRLKEDSMLLLRGFDSVAQTLSQLSNSLENALQGARDLARPPTMTEILQCTVEKAKYPEESPPQKKEDVQDEVEDEEGKRGLKRKLDHQECSDSDNQADDHPNKEHSKDSKEMRNLNKAKNLAISMATKAAAMAKELKSIKSDLCFMQERCTLLEEENKRLRDGFDKGMRPEEDDLVRLQLEALLAEKSRLANENANLSRENRCLHQLVEYHQATSQDLSASYENLIRGMCLDFSPPITPVPEVEDQGEEEHQSYSINNGGESTESPRSEILGFTKSLDKCFEEQ